MSIYSGASPEKKKKLKKTTQCNYHYIKIILQIHIGFEQLSGGAKLLAICK